MKVLIAEDDATERRILQAMIEKWGFDVVLASDGIAALKRLQEPDAPNLALLDWMMPGLDGVEVCRRLAESRPNDPPYLILVTGRDGREDVVKGLDAGANDYVCKPFSSRELLARIGVGQRVVGLRIVLAAKVAALQDALGHIKTLQGILPICSICHKIQNDENRWARIEEYIAQHSEAQFSHGLCPDCVQEHYSEYA